MEKQSFLPIKFYPVKEMQEYEKLKESDGYVLLKEHFTILPAFQFIIPNVGRHWGSDSFDLGTFELVEYNTGITYDLDSAVSAWQQGSHTTYNSGQSWRTLVWRRVPIVYPAPVAGRYYYHLIEDKGQTEWFSEVFELCNLEIDAFLANTPAGFGNDTGFFSFNNSWSLDDAIDITFCKSSNAAIAEAYIELECFVEEEFDLYILTQDRAGTCDGANRDWDNPAFFMFKTHDELTISEVFRVDTADTFYHFNAKVNAGGTVRLYMHIQEADLTEGICYVWLFRKHTPNHIQLRWHNDTNFCKLVYDQLPDAMPFQYENVGFFDAKQVIDENSINENVVEDDAANKYRIIGTDQKWNAVQFVGSECMLNTMSLLRLHNNIQIIREYGEVIDITEMLIEQSIVRDETALIKLRYREESCSEDNCGFSVCCPTEGTPILVGFFVVGDEPAAAANDGEYIMVETAPGTWQVYLSNGAAWAVNTVYRVVGTCLELEGFPYDYDSNNYYMRFWHTAGGVAQFYPFIEINTVVDATGGIATITTHTTYWTGAGVYCQVEYYNGTDWESWLPYFDEENWIACGVLVNLAAATGARVISCESGAGVGIWFRVHIWDGNCDYGYSMPIQQTIT